LKSLKSVINVTVVALAAMTISGCSVMKSGAESAAEVPSLENQANRIVMGMGIIRTNTLIANMPISADALWPDELNDDLVFEDNKQIISDALKDDPYVATHEYTDLYQKSQLGGIAFLPAPKIGNLTYSVLNRAVILYGPDEENWPTFFDIETDLSTFHKFKDGKVKQVEATSSNVYPNVTDALITLMPTNYQKDLHESRIEMSDALFEVAELKAQKGKYETLIATNNKPVADEYGTIPDVLSWEEILELKQQVLELETSISQKELIADEKETIYMTLLEEATKVLESDIELDDEQVALANNILLVSSAIKTGALEAGAAFALSTSILAATNIVEDFPKEMVTLAFSRIYIPRDKAGLFDRRLKRLAKNALYSVPAIAIGTYYALKQAYLAEQYEGIAEIIVEAGKLQKEAERDRLIDEEDARNAAQAEQGANEDIEAVKENSQDT